MAYTKTGTFTAGVAPGISAAFLNNLENYLTPGYSHVGVPLFSYFGPVTVTTTPTFFSHNMVNVAGTSVAPDVVLLQVTGASSNQRNSVVYDPSTMTTTQVKLTSSNNAGVSVMGVAMKF